MLATLLFADVVASTERVVAIGDRAWGVVLDRHDDAVRRQLARFSGHEEKFIGDGVLATFDRPARAIRCGTAIHDAARQIGLEVRVGIHTGEVKRRGTELAGIAVHLAHRTCEAAQPGEVFVSRTGRRPGGRIWHRLRRPRRTQAQRHTRGMATIRRHRLNRQPVLDGLAVLGNAGHMAHVLKSRTTRYHAVW